MLTLLLLALKPHGLHLITTKYFYNIKRTGLGKQLAAISQSSRVVVESNFITMEQHGLPFQHIQKKELLLVFN